MIRLQSVIYRCACIYRRVQSMNFIFAHAHTMTIGSNRSAGKNEVAIPAGCYLVSKTDTQGNITYVNDAFVSVSGYSRDELMGKPHNTVRHPDMPREAFADLWGCLKGRRPWQGLVKNRCKNGDFYWVKAFVAPIFTGSDVSGYISVRTIPSRNEVEAAAALYDGIRNGSGAKLRHPRSIWRRGAISSRLSGTMIAFMVMVLTLGGGGIYALNESNHALKKSYNEGLAPFEVVVRATELLSDNRTQILLAMQHADDSPFLHMHEHSIETHTDRMASNRAEIERLIGGLNKQALGAEALAAFKAFEDARTDLSLNGLALARKALTDGDYIKANILLLREVNPRADAVRQAGEAFLKVVTTQAQNNHMQADARFELLRNVIIGISVLALLLVVQAGYWSHVAIGRPSRRLLKQFEAISQGDLTEPVDIGDTDDFGKLSENLAIMQAHLKAMVDAIKYSGNKIAEDAHKIEDGMVTISDHSEKQASQSMSVASATEEFSQSVKGVSDLATEAAGAAQSSQKNVHVAHGGMEASVKATHRVVSAVRESSAKMQALEQVIDKITSLTDTIKDIADQTNLLALNAAIEAARAGEQGRGFAVVADEVRKLSERTARATSEIATMVNEVGHVTQESVGSISHVVEEAESSAEHMQDRIKDLDAIRAASDTVTQMAASIATATQEQAQASNDVAHSMENISHLIEQNVRHVRSAKETSASISGRATELKAMCNMFKT